MVPSSLLYRPSYRQQITMLGLVVIALCLLASAAPTKPSFCHDLDCPNYTVLRSFGVSFIIKRDMFHIIYINCICFAEEKKFISHATSLILNLPAKTRYFVITFKVETLQHEIKNYISVF